MEVTNTTPFYASAGVSAVGSIMGAYSSVKASKAKLEAVKFAIGEQKNNYIRQIANTYEKEQTINDETRTMLSARGLEAMKAESRLRSGVSSTGLSGTSMNEQINQSKYNELFDNTVLIARSRSTKVDLTRERLNDLIQFKQQTQSQVNSMGGFENSIGSAIAKGLGAGFNVFSQGVMMGGKLDMFSTSTANAPMSMQESNSITSWNNNTSSDMNTILTGRF